MSHTRHNWQTKSLRASSSQQNKTEIEIMTEKSDRCGYVNKLTEKDKADYVRKLTLTNGERLPDPFTLGKRQDNVMLLPYSTWADIYN